MAFMPDGYAHPEVLVDTVWLGDHLQDPAVRVAEVSEDVTLYDRGHIPGAVHFNWQTQLQDRVRRDWISKEQFEHLLDAYGIRSEEHTSELQSHVNLVCRLLLE